MENNTGISHSSLSPFENASTAPEPWELDEPNPAQEVAQIDDPFATKGGDLPGASSGNQKETNTIPETNEDAFPANLFSPTLVKIAEVLAQTRLYPIGFTMVSILFALSVIIGRSRVLQTSMGEFVCNLYILIVGEKGTYKSHPLMWALKPLLRHDAKLNRQYEEDYRAYERASAAEKANNSVQEPERPPLYLVNDITPEAIYYALLDNRNGIGMFGDEAFKVLTQGGRYNGKPEFDYLLSLFSGAPFIVRRATRRQNLIAEHPYFSFIGTIQPPRLFALFKGEKFDSGLFDRFLLVNEWGYRAKLWNLSGEVTREDEAEAQYQRIIAELTGSSTMKYKLSADAALSIESWQNEHERRLEHEGTDIEFGVFRKVQIYCMKFALLLQILWDIDTGDANPDHIISGNNAIRATALTDYFCENACSLAKELVNPVLNDKEKTLYDALPNAFTAKDGLDKAKAIGIGKTAYYAFLGKINGKNVEKKSRGLYVKKYMGLPASAHKYRS